jgi:hypothetical protein
MSRFAGRNGRVYLEIASGSSASPMPFVAQWEVNFPTDKVGVTAMGDGGKVTVNGLPDQTGAFSGFMDDSTAQTYTAATDGLARKFYLYPIASNNALYFWGTVNADVSFSAAVDGAGTFSSSWSAATTIVRVG